ncbi:MAG TPA: Panacea domain-containing protein [Chthoniobacterales bacterium]|nr:Panacea domain-containing protein [Chthoniobacterales bacterium]
MFARTLALHLLTIYPVFMPSALRIPAPIRKSTQALNYLAWRAAPSQRSRGKLNKMKALKLLFFADRYHLRKYGRPVSDCAYFAMRHGPVASEAKHVAEESPRLGEEARKYARRFVRKDDQYHFSSVGNVDPEVLSSTDREALDFAWETFGQESEFRLRDITHHYPEWKRQARALSGRSRRAPIDFTDFFSDPDPGYNACHELSAKERDVALELHREREAFHARWS